MSVNKVILIGRLGKDPELKHTSNGKTVCNFSLATSEKWTGQDGQKNESTTWHNIVAWGKQAEVMNEYLRKGQEVYIEGRIDNRSYEDKDGKKKYTSEVIVGSFQFIGSRDNAEEPQQSARVAGVKERSKVKDDDDLPF